MTGMGSPRRERQISNARLVPEPVPEPVPDLLSLPHRVT
jgi:hypothetical protein